MKILNEKVSLSFAISVSHEDLMKCKNRRDMETLALKYARQLEEKFIKYKQKEMMASVYGKVMKNEK